MQGIVAQAIRTCREKLLRSSPLRTNAMKMLLGLGQGQGCAASYTKTQDKGSDDMTTLTAAKSSESEMQQHKGLENMTVEEVLMTKEGEKAGSWLCCRMDDTVYDAVKQVCFLLPEDSLQTDLVSYIIYICISNIGESKNSCRWRRTILDHWWFSNQESSS